MKSYYLFCRRQSNYSIRSRSLTNSSMGIGSSSDVVPRNSLTIQDHTGAIRTTVAENEPLMMMQVPARMIPEEDDNNNNNNNVDLRLQRVSGASGDARKLPPLLPQDFDHDRERWANKFEFLLAVIGFSVDLGNVWRFPYICYRNGGGAFLIPYFTMFLLGGLPLFFLELALGQYQRAGCLSVWKKVCPVFKGIGFAICFIATYMSFFYNTIISWAVYFMFSSFRSVVPWKTCNNSWNTNSCAPILTPDEMKALNFSPTELEENRNASLGAASSAAEFFMREVLEIHRSKGLDDLGSIKWELALCLVGVYVVVYFALWKGPRSSGKAVWITATMPYIVLLILLVHGLMLPGAEKGIKYFLTPNWSRLYDTTVWIDAATQIFFSLGPGFGVLLALSSYNDFHNNCYKDAILTSFINCVTCLLSGFVIFSTLGYMSTLLDKPVSQVAGDGGPGLVFIVYPQAIATMKGSSFWAVIFFFMLITLGIDSTFAGLEALVTAFCDEFPGVVGRYREWFVLGLVVYCYCGTLPSTTYGGNYLVDFLDFYGVSFPVLFIVAVETIAVCWFYGVERFSNDVHQMLGFVPGIFWRSCWMVISPIFILVIFLFACLDQQSAATHNYPKWAVIAGWFIRMSSISCIPIYMIYHFLKSSGSFTERIKKCITPEIAGPLIVVPQRSTINSNNNILKFLPNELEVLHGWKKEGDKLNENENKIDCADSSENVAAKTTSGGGINSSHKYNALAQL